MTADDTNSRDFRTRSQDFETYEFRQIQSDEDAEDGIEKDDGRTTPTDLVFEQDKRRLGAHLPDLGVKVPISSGSISIHSRVTLIEESSDVSSQKGRKLSRRFLRSCRWRGWFQNPVL